MFSLHVPGPRGGPFQSVGPGLWPIFYWVAHVLITDFYIVPADSFSRGVFADIASEAVAGLLIPLTPSVSAESLQWTQGQLRSSLPPFPSAPSKERPLAPRAPVPPGAFLGLQLAWALWSPGGSFLQRV